MEKKKRLKVLGVSLMVGVIWSVYLLYSKRGGYIAGSDWFAIGVVCLLSIGLFFYFKKKW
ncbi:hypothetical protein LNQ49_16765 [Flavobacterium sp. F-65]|uniref:LPXTG-motif cell wall anchor domain-containing protein n=1 Tax=Flavobacterium pisciphilum TaxID=2893755 RepID=A0ABS8MWR7_9FLAO|nr:hypothetical protein [Flavobacterium sp. F-65]MCC9073231.1 hypothetical protein [Flavobacterium sp. F-65]